MIFISNKIHPNSNEAKYWADLTENPYGGVVKYYDPSIDQWVYVEEPIFQNSYASQITYTDIKNLQKLEVQFDITDSIYRQLEQKADKEDTYNKQYIDNTVATIVDTYESFTQQCQYYIDSIASGINNKIDSINGSISQLNANVLSVQKSIDQFSSNYVIKEDNKTLIPVDQLTKLQTLNNYDDTDLVNAVNLKASVRYVEDRISQLSDILGQTSQESLSTLQQLNEQLGDNTDISAQLINLISTKAESGDVYTKDVIDLKFNSIITDNNTLNSILNDRIPIKLSQLNNDVNYITSESDPTVPSWAKNPTKPTYTAKEVGALPSSTIVPKYTSQLINDKQYVTEQQTIDLITSHQCLSQQDIDKLIFANSSYKYDITSTSELPESKNIKILNIDPNYSTNIINIYDSVDQLILQFSDYPKYGYKYTIYVVPNSAVNILFPYYGIDEYHTISVENICRFDITALDIETTLLQGDTVLGAEESAITASYLGGYILEYNI